MLKVRCREYLSGLQNLTGEEIPKVDIAKALIKYGVSKQNDVDKLANNISNRCFNDGYFKPEEIKVLDIVFKSNENQLQRCNDNKNNCSEIPILGNVTASMGYGLKVCDETQTGTYAISNRLARDLGANLPECDIIFAKGDSMAPTIVGGDSLLVDKSKREVYDGRIYCVRYDGGLYAKRLQKLPPNRIKVVSDNKEKYDSWYVDFSKDISFDFEIIGEVIWWGRVAR